ncbi:hypothetical protein [Chitinimonas sp. JJ19]|uniref:hypothetical protein n=1 Tax=Chitinimonas sp. JJ19 TaxID=3109352 RepID=UPI003001653C
MTVLIFAPLILVPLSFVFPGVMEGLARWSVPTALVLLNPLAWMKLLQIGPSGVRCYSAFYGLPYWRTTISNRATFDTYSAFEDKDAVGVVFNVPDARSDGLFLGTSRSCRALYQRIKWDLPIAGWSMRRGTMIGPGGVIETE